MNKGIHRLLSFIDTEVSLIQDPIRFDTDLLLSGAVDSLAVVRITVWIEDEFGFEVDPVDITLDNFRTVELMASYIDAKVAVVD